MARAKASLYITLGLNYYHFLSQEYEKVQSRVNRQSRQRLADGKVRMMVTTDAQITQIEVRVERAPMAAALSGDVTGRVPLKVKMGAQVLNKVSIVQCEEDLEHAERDQIFH